MRVALPEITDEFMHHQLGRAQQYSLVLLRRGPKYEAPDRRSPEQAKIIWEHGRRNMALRAAGKMPLVGPVTGGDVIGISVFAGTPAETAALLRGDPAINAQILAADVSTWMSFPGDSLP